MFIPNLHSNSLLHTNSRPLALPCVSLGMLVDVAITLQVFYPKIYTNEDGVIHCSGLPLAWLLQLHLLHVP